MPAIARRDQVSEAEHAELGKDPVCGMNVDPHTARHRREHDGRTEEYEALAPLLGAAIEYYGRGDQEVEGCTCGGAQ